LEAIEVLRLVGTFILDVGDAVAVVVGVGAPVVVLEAVAVLGLVGTLVERIRDAVLIVVGIGASVRVLEPVPILGLIGAQILRVRDAVVVAVAAQHGAAGLALGRPRQAGQDREILLPAGVLNAHAAADGDGQVGQRMHV